MISLLTRSLLLPRYSSLTSVKSSAYAFRTFTMAIRQHYPKPSDAIRINNLSLNVYFRDGAQWSSKISMPTIQPVNLSLSIVQDVSQSAESDNLAHTLDYSALASTLTESANNKSFETLEDLVENVFRQSFSSFAQIQQMCVEARKPKGLLCGKAVSLRSSRSRGLHSMKDTTFCLEDIEALAVIGVNPEERIEKQLVRLNMKLCNQVSDAAVDYRQLMKRVRDLVDNSSYLTIEAFASAVANVLLQSVKNQWECVTVRAEKLVALALADSAGVEITRTISDYQSTEKHDTSKESILRSLIASVVPPPVSKPVHRVAIALGSNLGDRFANIETALRLLENPHEFIESDNIGEIAEAAVVDTSFLYETAPMYVTDQPNFVNCACLIETNLSPTKLLQVLKNIETAVGRIPSIRNGPRAVDLDVIFYDEEIIDTRQHNQRTSLEDLEGQLIIPHPKAAEREFVLRPLADIIPDYVVPSLHTRVDTLLNNLVAIRPTGTPVMKKVIPFPQYPLVLERPSQTVPPVPPTSTYWTYPVEDGNPHKTYIMATLNVTPDSFSDGSKYNTLTAALEYATAAHANGASIIDVGGHSTRPHADYVSPSEEIRRVIPVIDGIRNMGESAGLISVDTFRWEVAKAAVLAGANCINDVYAFTGTDYPLTKASARHFLDMRKVARDLAVPVILMHSRGEASANKDYTGHGSVIAGIRTELGEKVDAVIRGRGGLRRWFVIIDPGVGFSKTVGDNLEVLRHASQITSANLCGFPQLIGPSRKSFLGTILAQSNAGHVGRSTVPSDRGWATAAAVCCAVQQRALVVRVHDVVEMGDVTIVANCLWGKSGSARA